MKGKFLLISLAVMLGACSYHTYTAGEHSDESKSTTKVAFGYPNSSKTVTGNSIREKLPERGGDIQSVGFLPNATAFRMNGDYSDNVAVTLSPQGELLYFPAPTDLTADSKPVALGEGWWLNNQGLGPNSVFTKYTFAEYAAMPVAPSPEQIKLNIIPGSSVTGFMELPMKVGEASRNLEEAKEYVRNNK